MKHITSTRKAGLVEESREECSAQGEVQVGVAGEWLLQYLNWLLGAEYNPKESSVSSGGQ